MTALAVSSTKRGPYRAPAASLVVVAAKVPEVCIIRAFSIGFNQTAADIVREVLPYIGSLNPAVEWTAYKYEGRPFYWHDIAGVSAYGGGVYRWNHTGHDTYRDFVGLLHRPLGWAQVRDGRS